MKNAKDSSILIVTNSFQGGGAEKAMNLLANGLRLKGYSVDSLFINDFPGNGYPIENQIYIKRRYPSRFLDTIKSIYAFIKEVKFVNPSWIIINCSLPEFFSLFLPLKFKLIIVEHHPNPWGNRIALGRIVRFFLFCKKAIWVKVSDHFDVWGAVKLNARVIENLVNVPSAPNAGDRIERLIFIGRLENQKRPKLVLELANSLKLRALIIGHGSLKNDLINYADGVDLEVEFLDFQTNPWSHFSNGDLLVFPSSSEGDGLVAVEAILGKLPIILSDIRDFRKFELSEENYANDFESFKTMISHNMENLQRFIPQDSSISKLSAKRDESRLLNLWVQVIESK
jgi:glycosyltransferase involved in cell wall biosynthesis